MARKKGFTISKFRGVLYSSAKLLGDVQAVSSGSPKKMLKRIGRRFVGKFFSRILGVIFK